ncbi:uncharacterized protein [Garra rufa]|uniref:uncharacterized protein n=1 Tax=Garra rufa TaxID=137080 RepID=UPI003CCE6F2E
MLERWISDSSLQKNRYQEQVHFFDGKDGKVGVNYTNTPGATFSWSSEAYRFVSSTISPTSSSVKKQFEALDLSSRCRRGLQSRLGAVKGDTWSRRGKVAGSCPVSDGVKIRSSRAAAVCLGLLCVLLLTAVIVLCVHIHTKTTNYTQERQQLLTKITNLTEERDQLLTNNTNLIQLNVQWMFTDGWIYYEFSLYYISNETKSWAESRTHCTERGADLIIINNSEKQDFVKKMSSGSEVWIGLTDSDEEDTWKWVDNSALTFRFWNSEEPNGHEGENCAISLSTGWADYPCTSIFKWICERKTIK